MRYTRKICKYFSLTAIILLILLWKEEINEDFLQLSTCPACYGVNCNISAMQNGNLMFPSSYKWFNYFLNIKNIYYYRNAFGTYVFKRLAHADELHNFDDMLYSFNVKGPDILTSLWNASGRNINSFIKRYQRLFSNNEILKCNHSKVIDRALYKFEQYDKSSSRHLHFLTILAINPEPLMLMMFENDLPFPQFIGCCGRILVEQYAGLSLTHFYNHPWNEREKIAKQLLNIAIMMSENPIRIYLTDPSPDNFAVDHQGVIRLIDVEDLVLVDGFADGIDSSEHQNDGIGCSDCLSYSYEDLCTHSKSDHNYFAICKGLLSQKPFSGSIPGGFLHGMPAEIIRRKPELRELIEECSQPRKMRRKDAANLLLKLLQD